MNSTKIISELDHTGFSLISFPKKLKNAIVDHIESYLSQVISRENLEAKKSKIKNYEEYANVILTMDDANFLSHFSKAYRMFPDEISHLIVDWIKTDLRKILEVSQADSSYVSFFE